MMGHKICFYGEIWIIIPKLFGYHFLSASLRYKFSVWFKISSTNVSRETEHVFFSFLSRRMRKNISMTVHDYHNVLKLSDSGLIQLPFCIHLKCIDHMAKLTKLISESVKSIPSCIRQTFHNLISGGNTNISLFRTVASLTRYPVTETDTYQHKTYWQSWLIFFSSFISSKKKSASNDVLTISFVVGLGLACQDKGHCCHTKKSTLAKIFTEKIE